MKREKHEKIISNFLSSIDLSIPRWMHLVNLDDDARSYQWEDALVKTIQEGIDKLYGKKANAIKAL